MTIESSRKISDPLLSSAASVMIDASRISPDSRRCRRSASAATIAPVRAS
jgi:hypothetical protein